MIFSYAKFTRRMIVDKSYFCCIIEHMFDKQIFSMFSEVILWKERFFILIATSFMPRSSASIAPKYATNLLLSAAMLSRATASSLQKRDCLKIRLNGGRAAVESAQKVPRFDYRAAQLSALFALFKTCPYDLCRLQRVYRAVRP